MNMFCLTRFECDGCLKRKNETRKENKFNSKRKCIKFVYSHTFGSPLFILLIISNKRFVSFSLLLVSSTV